MKRLSFIFGILIVLSLFVSSCYEESEQINELVNTRQFELASKKKEKKITYISSEKKIRLGSGETAPNLVCKAELNDSILVITFEGCIEDASIVIIDNLTNDIIYERSEGEVDENITITIEKLSYIKSFYIKVESPTEILQGYITYP